MTIPAVRTVIADTDRERYTCICLQSRMRWHIPFTALQNDRKAQKAWKGLREANWRIGLHGQAVDHAVLSVTEH